MAKIGRNEPCPCGSGKKHKKCCLETTAQPGAVAEVLKNAALSDHEHVCDFCSDEVDEVDEVDELDDRADHILDELLGGRVDVAEALAHDFIRDFPGEAEGFDLLSMVYEGRGQRERALALLRQASEIAHANPDYDADTRLMMRERIMELEVGV